MSGPQNAGRFPYTVDPGETAPVPVRPQSLPALFEQGKWWRQQSGEWVRVKDMHPAHRANAARLLLRDAADYALRMSNASAFLFTHAPDEVIESAFAEDAARTADPVAWMRSTKLYRRLMKGLVECCDDCVERCNGRCTLCHDKPLSEAVARLTALPDFTLTVPVGGPPEVTYATDDAQIRADDARPSDPWEEAAQARALRHVLAIFDERLKRGGPYHSRALLQRDVRDLVVEAARQIGVTL